MAGQALQTIISASFFGQSLKGRTSKTVAMRIGHSLFLDIVVIVTALCAEARRAPRHAGQASRPCYRTRLDGSTAASALWELGTGSGLAIAAEPIGRARSLELLQRVADSRVTKVGGLQAAAAYTVPCGPLFGSLSGVCSV